MTNYLLMSEQELNIKSIMDKLLSRDITEEKASKLIWKSLRQTQRIKKRYKKEWDKGLIHKSRWKESNHKHDPTKYEKAIKIIKEKYLDYWPTLCSERLEEKYSIKVSMPTLRNEMIRRWIWKVKKRKKIDKQFTARPRKESYWEMLQYDWSYHKWFEGRNWTKYQCLLVSVDDASWELTCKFDNNKGLVATFKYWKEYILARWKPKSIYLDKYATYKVNYPTATDDKDLPTQFGRVCKTLGIQLIFANTPQAKWRVERMNYTLQDRLVKALREENISDINIANKFLKEKFIPEFNKKFMVEPRNESNLHIELREDEKEKLNQIFSEHQTRKVANDYTISFERKIFQLYRRKDSTYYLKPGWKITVERHLDWTLHISRNGIYIENKLLEEKPKRRNNLWTAPVIDTKEDVNNFRASDTCKSNLIDYIEKTKTIREKKEEFELASKQVDFKEDYYYMRQWG